MAAAIANSASISTLREEPTESPSRTIAASGTQM